MRTADGIDVIITTPSWRAGAQAAVSLFKTETNPNWPLIERMGGDFAVGFRHRWDEIAIGGLSALDV